MTPTRSTPPGGLGDLLTVKCPRRGRYFSRLLALHRISESRSGEEITISKGTLSPTTPAAASDTYPGILELFWKIRVLVDPVTMSALTGSWVHALNEVRRRRGRRSSQRVLMPACSKLLRKS